MELETKAIHEGWKPGNGEPRQLPIYESTTFKYDSSEEMGMLFDLEKDGYFYSHLRTANMIPLSSIIWWKQRHWTDTHWIRPSTK